MYAMRFGTVPLVRRVGGLKDTVVDYGEPEGYGICFNHSAVGDITHAIWRAVELYRDRPLLHDLRRRMMSLDFSWETSVGRYIDLYRQIT